MSHYKSFETERLLLKPTSIEDAEFIFELLNSPKWLQNIGDRNIRTLQDAEKYITEKMLPQFERLGFSNYTILRKPDLQKIGTCGLYDREGIDGIDIGYALLPEFEGKGYAFEAAHRLKSAAVQEYGIEIMSAITTKENLPSQKLLEKLGLKLIGTKRIPNDDEELLFYRTE